MASLATIRIDAFEFARDGRVLDGTIPFAEFLRLRDVLQRLDGYVQVRVAGKHDDDGRSWLQVECSGLLVLRCQRCLECLDYPLNISSRLQLRAGGLDVVDWSDEDLDIDEFDVIPASQPWLVKDLIEDEVILQLPVSPVHSACALPNPDLDNHTPSPFAALAKLKKY